MNILFTISLGLGRSNQVLLWLLRALCSMNEQHKNCVLDNSCATICRITQQDFGTEDCTCANAIKQTWHVRVNYLCYGTLQLYIKWCSLFAF